MVRLLARVIGRWHRDGGHAGAGGAVAETCATDGRWRVMRASRARPTRAEEAPRERAGAIRESLGFGGA